MNTLPQVVENLRRDRPDGDTERALVLRSAMLMAIHQLEGQTALGLEAIRTETALILAQYPDVWPVTE